MRSSCFLMSSTFTAREIADTAPSEKVLSSSKLLRDDEYELLEEREAHPLFEIFQHGGRHCLVFHFTQEIKESSESGHKVVGEILIKAHPLYK
jgi:hypothetical protein